MVADCFQAAGQLFHQGWDQHGDLVGGIIRQCRQTDQASAALVTDLKRRGLLEDTLVIWGGEFGRTAYSQGKITPNNYGGDRHPGCFSSWSATSTASPTTTATTSSTAASTPTSTTSTPPC